MNQLCLAYASFLDHDCELFNDFRVVLDGLDELAARDLMLRSGGLRDDVQVRQSEAILSFKEAWIQSQILVV